MSHLTSGRKKSSDPKAGRPYVPGYGIPKTLKGLLPWRFVEERMTKSKTYWVCTTGPKGQPHARPVWGVWVEGAICFGGHGVRWERNLEANPAVSVHLESGDDVVILEGTAKRITDPRDPMVELCAKASKAKYKMGGGVPFWVLAPDRGLCLDHDQDVQRCHTLAAGQHVRVGERRARRPEPRNLTSDSQAAACGFR